VQRFGPSILVEAGEATILFDCGRGATQRLFQLSIPLAEVNELLLTHLHSDHVVGIPDLWLTGWVFGRRVPLRVRGPAGTREMTSHLEKAFEFDVRTRRDLDERLPAQGVVLLAEDIEPGVVCQARNVKVTAFEVDHGPVRPALGYRIDFDGRSAVLSGDTRLSENLVRHARSTDLLVHEVAAAGSEPVRDPILLRRVLAHHISPEEAGEVFTRVRPRLAVYSHIVLLGGLTTDDLLTRTRETYSGPLEVGEDLMAIDVGEAMDVRRAGQPTSEG
jgi:ribonuclease Z